MPSSYAANASKAETRIPDSSAPRNAPATCARTGTSGFSYSFYPDSYRAGASAYVTYISDDFWIRGALVLAYSLSTFAPGVRNASAPAASQARVRARARARARRWKNRPGLPARSSTDGRRARVAAHRHQRSWKRHLFRARLPRPPLRRLEEAFNFLWAFALGRSVGHGTVVGAVIARAARWLPSGGEDRPRRGRHGRSLWADCIAGAGAVGAAPECFMHVVEPPARHESARHRDPRFQFAGLSWPSKGYGDQPSKFDWFNAGCWHSPEKNGCFAPSSVHWRANRWRTAACIC